MELSYIGQLDMHSLMVGMEMDLLVTRNFFSLAPIPMTIQNFSLVGCFLLPLLLLLVGLYQKEEDFSRTLVTLY